VLRKFLFLLLLVVGVLHAEDLKALLSGYKKESELSNITKRDAAGILELFTRDDLEKMQVHSLLDVLEAIPGIYLQRGSNNLTLLSTSSKVNLPLTYTRLYINDHDVTSSSFGSAFLIWGEMPVEYIDHIEVYKATSSMEFGNENGAVIIRLYTKKASRENGSKLKVGADDFGSLEGNFYTAQVLDNGISYFAFANGNNIKRTTYHNTYNNNTYDYNSNRESYNIYGDINYKSWRFELNVYKKNNDGFIGIGSHKTPNGGGLETNHTYLHITKTFQNDLKLQLSYDKSTYNRTYNDPNGIRVANAPLLNHYGINFDDDIFAVILEKKFKTTNNSLLLGAFYKNKGFESNGDYYDTNLSYRHTNDDSNALALSSVYAEDKYNINQNFQLIGSIKGDFFRYEKDVKSQNELLARGGFIYNYDKYKLKAFYTKGYVPLAFYQIYNPENMPYRANPQLDTIKTDIYTADLEYKSNQQTVSLEIAQMRAKDLLVYDRTTVNGWKNSSAKYLITVYQLDYTYRFDLNNKFSSSFIYGNNSDNMASASPFNILLKSFNKYKKFDFYNALNYKSSYTSIYGSYIKSGFEFTSALKYHYNKDLMLGLKGENIFHDASQEAYRGVAFTIPTVDQKFWLNVEYLF